MEILVLILIIAGTYFFLKVFTVHRCPHCQSRYINRNKNMEVKSGYKVYVCSACGKVTERKNLFYKKNNV
ncbi:MAG: hypothetical protein K2N11_05620 [Mucispirillum sp.]|nr:hypothetical protein [Mucispirillum sp.]